MDKSSKELSITRGRRYFEIVAVVLTGILKIVFVDIFPLKFWYILAAMVFWIGYLAFRAIDQPIILSNWGFTKQNFKSTSIIVLPFAAISIAGFLIYGLINNNAVINWHIIPVLVLYPVWGLIQQFLVIGLIAGNLRELSGTLSNRTLVVTVTAILFSIVHYPSTYLIAATFLLAIFYTIIFLRKRNLWPLGIFHGWLGGLFYFLVLGRDPWVEVFSTF